MGTVLSTIGSVVGIASGVNSLMGGNGSGNAAGGAYNDWFAPYREKYGQKLDELVSGKPKDVLNTVYNSPLYAGGLAEGERSLGRGLAARGLTESGAENLAYKGYGQDYFTKQYQNLYNQYTGLSGATQQPLDMSNMNSLNAQQNQAGWGAIAQGIGGLKTIFPSSSNPSDPYTPNNYASGYAFSPGYTGYSPTNTSGSGGNNPFGYSGTDSNMGGGTLSPWGGA